MFSEPDHRNDKIDDPFPSHWDKETRIKAMAERWANGFDIWTERRLTKYESLSEDD